MAPAFVQIPASGGNSVSSATVAASPVSADVTPGNLVVAVASTNGAAIDTAVLADNSTQPGDANVYQYVFTLQANTGGNTGLHIFMCKVTRRLLAGVDGYTCTFSATTSRKSIIVAEYSGFQYPIAAVRVQATGTATTVTSATATNRYQNDALEVLCVSNNTGVTTGQTMTGATNGFTVRLGGNNSGGATVAHEATIVDKVVAVRGANQTSPTDASTVGWVTAMVSFEEALDIRHYNPRSGRVVQV